MTNLNKLLIKTLLPVQLLGYSLALFLGLSILFSSYNLYIDLKPIFKTQTNITTKNTIAISKKVTLFKTLNKEKIYFSKKEIDQLKKQEFVEQINTFKHATYKIKAKTSADGNFPGLQTDLFFESIPHQLIDVSTENFIWSEGNTTIPIIIPEAYLKLYNFGFAESQGLPVISKNAIKELNFNIEIYGNNKMNLFNSKIVGFSNEFNSVLVPESFIEWSNKIYGEEKSSKVSRILISPNNKRSQLLSYFNEKNYDINKNDLQNDKLVKLVNIIFFILITIALIIVILAFSFIYLSINLILAKNKKLIQNLYSIGYSTKALINFYFKITITTTIITLIFSIVVSQLMRQIYSNTLSKYFVLESQYMLQPFIIILSFAMLYFGINRLITKQVKKIVKLS